MSQIQQQGEIPKGVSPNLLNKTTVEALSGLSAGFITTIITHPLDLLKLRMQLDTTNWRSPWNRIRVLSGELLANSVDAETKKLKVGSFTKELYRGITPNLIGSTSAWGLYFMFYYEYKKLIATMGSKKELDSGEYLASGFAAGISTSLITNPIWVLKTRIISTSRKAPGAYLSTLDGARRILKEEGILGFWKGLPPALISVSQGALQFSIYDTMKTSILKQQEDNLTTFQYIYTSAISKMVSTVALYPFQVMRSRLQGYTAIDQPKTMIQVAKKLVKKEGFTGFYKGVVPNLIRVVPATCITFVVYENARTALS
ncbi:unnamed protein product [Kuraishia capsulata CBS 1993]|uniref:Uncharacterized protein n=1 Tax=Kuraishia capsulata CBS 1993 TaxID=1382522 RepID=W6MI00_9ASCO|nr:uncharacterized protein KUCA_T00001443001 [Kuraishia capsulata CBS 1993]CDK25473.1 unnamed protein product [Kuraishia capsulata CBS 1993]